MNPPKSTSGETALTLSMWQKLALAGLVGLTSWNLKTTLETHTEVRMLQVRFETRDNDIMLLRQRICDVEDKSQQNRDHCNAHIGSKGHVVAISRADRIEADIRELKERK